MANREALLIEPEPSIARVLSLLLEEADLSLYCVAGFRDGLAILQNARPAMVIIDVAQPLRYLPEIGEIRDASPAPLVLLTTSDDLAGDLTDRGIDEVVREPFEPQDLLSRVRSLLSR